MGGITDSGVNVGGRAPRPRDDAGWERPPPPPPPPARLRVHPGTLVKRKTRRCAAPSVRRPEVAVEEEERAAFLTEEVVGVTDLHADFTQTFVTRAFSICVAVSDAGGAEAPGVAGCSCLVVCACEADGNNQKAYNYRVCHSTDVLARNAAVHCSKGLLALHGGLTLYLYSIKAPHKTLHTE